MIVMLSAASVGFAAERDRYPACAEVAVAEKGAVRIHVPLSLRSVDDPQDGSDLVLYDAAGREVPFARLEGDAGRTEPISPQVTATLDPFTFRIDPGALPVDEIVVDLQDAAPAAEVTVRAGETVVGQGLVWSLPDTQSLTIPIRPTPSVLEITVTPTTPISLLRPVFRVVRRRIPAIPREEVDVPVGPPILQENGYARIVVPLPAPMQVDHLTAQVVDPIFSRQAGVAADPWTEAPVGLHMEAFPGSTRPITRVKLGELSVESTTLDGPWPATDRLSLLIASQGMAPLDVERVTLGIEGVQLVALDAGAGPHTLCGGAPPGTTAVSDLAVAAPELGRLAATVVEPGPVEPNPGWIPPEVRGNLVAPGVELALDPFRTRRPVNGTGLVRIALPNALLSEVRMDLSDLRLVSDGRQVPYLLRRRAEAPVVDGLATERVEEGPESRIAVHLPTRGLRVARLRLTTPATVFDREITISRPLGSTLEPLRSVRWIGRDRPGSLNVDLEVPVDDALVVTIRNGDDPPLPIDGVDLWVDAWEILAVIPEGGADLVSGAPTVEAPDYDLRLVEETLARRPAGEATLGDPVDLRRTRLSTLDRVLLAIGIGALGVGLVGLGLDLVRRLPAETRPDPEPA